MKEKCKGIHLFFFATSSLLECCFIGYIVIPMSVNFVATFKVSDLVLNQFTLDSYIGLETSVLARVIFFELPIIIYFLTKLGLVTPCVLRTYRKYAITCVLSWLPS
jgi:sec-independent protein translocase protein TatC